MMASSLCLPDLTLTALAEWLAAQGQPAFRAKQIYRHLYRSLAEDFSQMTDLPVGLRERLSQAIVLQPLRLLAQQISSDGLTRKALFELPDGNTVETVLMLYGGEDAEGRVRRTVCLSTQAGCAMGCAFCATGQGGLRRNLTAGEIVAQVLHFAREVRRAGADAVLTNLIFAGMGEPLANYSATWSAVERLNDPEGFGLGARHMTISTAGWVPGIARLAKEKLQVGLAVSLHAPDDAMRDQLMPINRKYPIAVLMDACRDYTERTNRRVSFEYILVAGVNAGPAQARSLAALLKGMLCHVNLIPMNPVAGTPWRPPSHREAAAFAHVLEQSGITVTQRMERGSDIQAACGQLRARQAGTTGAIEGPGAKPCP
ncbi:MAG: 23S rRNA (adenine(2503)-C(2))-methyltransferase RlmN [Chloroflexota bacterium]|nr:23S rRNA (adenine(2503)-C(2))-methyltransferase RlmN [Chloroflexota bacterium]